MKERKIYKIIILMMFVLTASTLAESVRSLVDNGNQLYSQDQFDKAIEEYERLTTFNPDSWERFLIHPEYHYELAKLYQEKGLKDKAIEE